MKNKKRIALLLLMLAAALLITACFEGERKFDPSLEVITDANIGLSGSLVSVTVEYDTSLGETSVARSESGLTLSAVPKGDCDLIGWYADGGYEKLLSYDAEFMPTEDELRALASDENGSLVIYCRFGRKYSLSYELSGGSLTDAAPDFYVTEQKLQPLTDKVYKTGSRFIGWRILETGETVSALPSGISGDLSLSAVYDDVTCVLPYENTVWQMCLEGSRLSAVLVFLPDGSLDIFSSLDGSPYVNGGAFLALRCDYERRFAEEGSASREALSAVRYDPSRTYYGYRAWGECGVEIFTEGDAFLDSYLIEISKASLGDVKYYLTPTESGDLSLTVYASRSLTYQGVSYSAEEFREYITLGCDGIPDMSDITYNYEYVDTGIYFERVAEAVTDCNFRAFSSSDIPQESFSIGDGLILSGTNTYLEVMREGKYYCSGAAFLHGGELYITRATVDFVDVIFPSVIKLDEEYELLPTAVTEVALVRTKE